MPSGGDEQRRNTTIIPEEPGPFARQAAPLVRTSWALVRPWLVDSGILAGTPR